MFINLAGNSEVTVAIDDVQRITFEGDKMLLITVTGTEKSYLLDDIASISTLSNLTVISHWAFTLELTLGGHHRNLSG